MNILKYVSPTRENLIDLMVEAIEANDAYTKAKEKLHDSTMNADILGILLDTGEANRAASLTRGKIRNKNLLLSMLN